MEEIRKKSQAYSVHSDSQNSSKHNYIRLAITLLSKRNLPLATPRMSTHVRKSWRKKNYGEKTKSLSWTEILPIYLASIFHTWCCMLAHRVTPGRNYQMFNFTFVFSLSIHTQPITRLTKTNSTDSTQHTRKQ
jgi:hypothetical protein